MSAKVYQVVYCDSKSWVEDRELLSQTEKTLRWYLLECPLIGFKDLAEAREQARVKLKAVYGGRAQPVIVGEARGEYSKITADDLLGITLLREANATEASPSIVFTKRGRRPVFYSRAEDLGYGRFPP